MPKAKRVFKGYRWGIDQELSEKEAFILKQDQNTKVNELESEQQTKEPVRELGHQAPDTPLFLRDTSDGEKGNAQDEKDTSEE
jgi:hypothetical protein